MGGTLDPEEFQTYMNNRARELFHKLWGIARGPNIHCQQEDYDKHDWQELQTILNQLKVRV